MNYYKSWKELTDKVYMLGSIDQKEKPRPFVVDLLKQAECDYVRYTGSIEGRYVISSKSTVGNLAKASVGPVTEYDHTEVVLPDHIGLIKSVNYNGQLLSRFNSDEMQLEESSGLPTNTITGWNMHGSKFIKFNGVISDSDMIVIYYESSLPDENLFLKCYKVFEHEDDNDAQAWIEPHAFGDEWIKYGDGKDLLISGTCVSSTHPGDDVGTYYSGRIFENSIYTGNMTMTRGGVYSFMNPSTDITQGVDPDLDPDFISTASHQANYFQKINGTMNTDAVYVNGEVLFVSHREDFGPTIQKSYHDILPYYALGLIFQPVNPQLADYYMAKFTTAIDMKSNEYLNNDLVTEIQSKVRSNWRY